MKKIILTIVSALLAVNCFSQTKNVTGTWLGTLDVGVKVRLVLHINRDTAGFYNATMDSPDQGAKDIPVSSVTIEGDSLHVGVNIIKGNFDGLITNDMTITGTWSQGIAKLPLTIVRTNQIIALNRPQTPKPPFAYKSEDVEYFNADRSVHFGGTFTYPDSAGTFPTAILITGSGQQDRDETIFEHKPFAVIADYLTKRGFAILRVDDRGIGKTTGEAMTATSADFAKDVEAGISFLKSRPQTDTSRLGLIGHSEGGLIAALIAARRKDINFMILLAGPGIKGSLLLADQEAAILQSQGVSAAAANSYKSFYSQLINISLGAKDTATAFKEASTAFKQWEKTVSQVARKQLNLINDSVAEMQLRILVKTFSLPWMKYFLNSDPAILLKKTNAKVLALNGEKDVQVLAKPNLAGIIVALQKSKSRIYDAKMLQNLNHLFQRCIKCSVAEYAQIEETISPDALTAMGDWLQKNVHH